MNRAHVPSENVTSKYFQMLTCQQKNELYGRQVISNAQIFTDANRSNNFRTGYKYFKTIPSMSGISIHKKVRLPSISKFQANSNQEQPMLQEYAIAHPYNEISGWK